MIWLCILRSLAMMPFDLRVRPCPKSRGFPYISVTFPPASSTRSWPAAWSYISVTICKYRLPRSSPRISCWLVIVSKSLHLRESEWHISLDYPYALMQFESRAILLFELVLRETNAQIRHSHRISLWQGYRVCAFRRLSSPPRCGCRALSGMLCLRWHHRWGLLGLTLDHWTS